MIISQIKEVQTKQFAIQMHDCDSNPCANVSHKYRYCIKASLKLALPPLPIHLPL